jgi:hypothetical protein
MNVNTSEFRALADRVAALEAELAASLPLLSAAYGAGRTDGYDAGVESVLGRPAAAPRPRQRHLRAVPGGAR